MDVMDPPGAAVARRLLELTGPPDFSPLCVADYPDKGSTPRATLSFFQGRVLVRVNRAMRDLARQTAPTSSP
jgi:hypothetical protein